MNIGKTGVKFCCRFFFIDSPALMEHSRIEKQQIPFANRKHLIVHRKFSFAVQNNSNLNKIVSVRLFGFLTQDLTGK